MILRNIAANTLGLAVTVLTQATTMILAYRLAGPEQYGLIGFFGTLLTAAAILDVGLGQTVVREVARRRAVDGEADGPATVLFTFQVLYVVIAAAVALVLVLTSALIARHWLKAGHISVGEVQVTVAMMGVAIAIQRLRGVYQSTLDGLERQVLSNGLASLANLLRLALGVGALLLVAPTASAYFTGQIVASTAETGLFAIVAWRVLPPFMPGARRFDRSLLSEASGFAGANAASAAVGTAVQVSDAVIVSAVMPLSVFGSYALVSQLCTLMLRLVTPLLIAVLPRLSLYVREERRADLARLFFTYSHAMAALLVSAAGILIGFGGAVLLALTARPGVAQSFALPLALLSTAYALNGLSRAPHGLRLAEGDPVTALRINLVIAVIYLPAAALLTPRLGVAAPAGLLLIANGLGFLVFIWRAFTRLLRGLRLAWCVESLIWPALAAGGVCAVARLVTPPSAAIPVQLTVAVICGTVALAVGASTPSRLGHRFRFQRRLWKA